MRGGWFSRLVEKIQTPHVCLDELIYSHGSGSGLSSGVKCVGRGKRVDLYDMGMKVGSDGIRGYRILVFVCGCE